MALFRIVAYLDCDTPAHADIVMWERLEYDEQYDDADGNPFDYQFTSYVIEPVEGEERLMLTGDLYPLECDTCGTIGTPDDGIEPGGPCAHDWCDGTIRRRQGWPSLNREQLLNRIVAIYRTWTGPNGWDINIMSDIAGLLVEQGAVDESDPIISGEWPDD